ncbi:MAG: peptide ABC transporter substrate-binding protein [Opitutaceae bacterium]|nr:peptide ABC transporter substrate-binding protein [Opitutaceae bacterium]
MRVSLLRPCAAVALLFAFTACTKRETPVAASLRTQTLHFGNLAEPATLDPQANTMMAEWEILTALFEGLVNVANDGVTILPGMAERWEISADGLTYTFHLRRGLQWSNGDSLTAPDIVESMRRLLNPAIGFSSVEQIDPIVGARAYLTGKTKDFSTVGVRAPDPSTVEFRLAYRAPYFLVLVSNTAFICMPVHVASVARFGGLDRRGGKWTLPGNLVSNGPFVLKTWRPNQVIVAARNERYWDSKRVRLSEVHFHPIEDPGAEERAFRSGQLHTTWGLPASKLDAYQRTRPAELSQAPILHTQYITFNCSRPPFTDPRVRRAFALATNRESATTAGFRGRAQTARSFVRPGTGRFEPPQLATHDPAEAKRLLAAAGFPDGRGFPAAELRLSTGGSDVTAVAEILQQQWRQVLGVSVSLLPMESKVLIASLYAHDFTLAMSGYFPLDDPSDMLARAEKDGPANFSTWQHPQFEAAGAEVRQAATDADRLAAFAKMERLIAEEVPYLPLFHLNQVHVVHPSVKGWRANRFAQVDWRELWLEAPE